jgi:transcriptional regulator with XRE-family HTH domain
MIVMPKRKKGPQPVDREVGARIRQARLVKGWSQTKLGDALGITFQQIQKYEKGINRVGAGRLQEIADHLDTTVTTLFGHRTDGEEPAPLIDTLALRKLVMMIKSMTPRQQHALQKIAETLIAGDAP